MPSAYEGNGYYIMLAKEVYHTAKPYIKGNVVGLQGRLIQEQYTNSPTTV